MIFSIIISKKTAAIWMRNSARAVYVTRRSKFKRWTIGSVKMARAFVLAGYCGRRCRDCSTMKIHIKNYSCINTYFPLTEWSIQIPYYVPHNALGFLDSRFFWSSYDWLLTSTLLTSSSKALVTFIFALENLPSETYRFNAKLPPN